MKPISIVLVTWYRQQITKMCLDAIIQNTKPSNYRLIVIDNGSPEKMKRMLSDYHDLGLIHELVLNNSNRGLEPARNQGLELVNGKYFVCADNDCLVQKIKNGKDWLEKLVDLMEKHLDYGAISCRTQVMIGSGNIFDKRESGEIVDFPHPGGSFRIMRTNWVKAIGGWREEVGGRGTEERYICGRLNEQGHKTAFAVQVRCLHLFGDKNTDRWGYDKDWTPENSGHSDIAHPALDKGDDPKEIKEYLNANK